MGTEWMNKDQIECYNLLCDLFGGAHHFDSKVKPCGAGIEMNTHQSFWATFDFNGLTRAVVLAHDRMIRFEVCPCNMQYIKLRLWKRHTREGGVSERHPTIEQAIKQIRFNSETGAAERQNHG